MSRPIFNVKPDVRPSPHRSHRHQLRAASGSPKAAPSPTRASHLGPLTTAFAQPSQCTRAILACPTCDTAWKGLSCNANWANGQQIVAPEDNTSCFPSATAYPKRPRSAFEGLGFYSPGTICPTGYTQACKAVSTKAGQTAPSIATPGPMTKGALQFPLVAGETAIGCCPTGYTCAQYPGHAWQTCHQVATSTKMDAATCSMDGQGPIKGFAVPFTTDGKTVTKLPISRTTMLILRKPRRFHHPLRQPPLSNQAPFHHLHQLPRLQPTQLMLAPPCPFPPLWLAKGFPLALSLVSL
jgi:hypothetical protein